jgi:uncharacterized membrane protein YphA (DoxX/SURF4 family)
VNFRIQPYVFLLARIFMACIFLIVGISKIFTADAIRGYMEAAHLPGILFWPAVIFEIVGGLAILVGYQSRFAALALAGYCLLTALLFHSNLSDQIQLVMLLKNVAMAGGFLYLASLGPGPISIDMKVSGRNPRKAKKFREAGFKAAWRMFN